MDQDLLQRAYQELNDNFCAYEKAILARYCDCPMAERLCIAEREGISCNSSPSRTQCLSFLDLLRYQARFVLKNMSQNATIPHAKLLKIQVGGLRGLQAALDIPKEVHPGIIADTNGLLEAAKAQFGSIECVPFQIIIQHIAAFEGRTRHRRRS